MKKEIAKSNDEWLRIRDILREGRHAIKLFPELNS
jgi:hypothetical protein